MNIKFVLVHLRNIQPLKKIGYTVVAVKSEKL